MLPHAWLAVVEQEGRRSRIILGEDFLTTALLNSVCQWFMETTTKQQHGLLQTGTLMYVHTQLYT